MRKDLIKKDEVVKALQLNCDRLNTDLDEANKQLKSRHDEREDLRKELRSSEERLNKEVTAAHRELVIKFYKTCCYSFQSTTKSELSSRDEEIRKLNEKLKCVPQESQMLNNELNDKNSQIIELQRACDELRNEKRHCTAVEKDLTVAKRELV